MAKDHTPVTLWSVKAVISYKRDTTPLVYRAEGTDRKCFHYQRVS